VRELIPEFFCLPDFLVNKNNFDLGITQKGEEVIYTDLVRAVKITEIVDFSFWIRARAGARVGLIKCLQLNVSLH
jgi:hypothetical protein